MNIKKFFGRPLRVAGFIVRNKDNGLFWSHKEKWEKLENCRVFGKRITTNRFRADNTEVIGILKTSEGFTAGIEEFPEFYGENNAGRKRKKLKLLIDFEEFP